MFNVVIWNEFRHEVQQDAFGDLCRKSYPNGIHACLKEALGPKLPENYNVSIAALDDPDQGLPDEVLEKTDVLLWWGHCSHHEVKDELVAKIHNRVLRGMGLIVLHSGHFSKIFKAVTGTPCNLLWREANEKERVWVCDPSHPIAQGIPASFPIAETEMYGEPFGIPADAHPVFMSWYEGGNVFRSGITMQRGLGKIFYFSPGHETHPIYHIEEVQNVLRNAIVWATSPVQPTIDCPNEKDSTEPIAQK